MITFFNRSVHDLMARQNNAGFSACCVVDEHSEDMLIMESPTRARVYSYILSKRSGWTLVTMTEYVYDQCLRAFITADENEEY